MLQETLAAIARAPFAVTPDIREEPACYEGTRIPLRGAATLEGAEESLSMTIVDEDDWATEMLRSAPGGFVNLTAGGLFRDSAPGMLVDARGVGTVSAASGRWNARVTNLASGTDQATGHARYGFRVRDIVLVGPGWGHPVGASRHIFQGAAWRAASIFDGRRVLARELRDGTEREDEILGLTIEGELDGVTREAFWLLISFVTGNRVAPLAAERYGEDGKLIDVVHRRGAQLSVGRHELFDRFEAPLRPQGIASLADGMLRLMRAKPSFPIAMIVHHFLDANTGVLETDAQHYVLAIHTAIEAWNRRYGPAVWIDDDLWESFADGTRRTIFAPIADTIGTDMKRNLANLYRYANRTTTSDRQGWMFEALGIDLDDNDKRALRMRDELLHNGYFLQRFHELGPTEQQQRLDNIARLRRLAAMVVFRLTAFRGAFLDTMRYMAVEVAPVPLPHDIAPPSNF